MHDASSDSLPQIRSYSHINNAQTLGSRAAVRRAPAPQPRVARLNRRRFDDLLCEAAAQFINTRRELGQEIICFQRRNCSRESQSSYVNLASQTSALHFGLRSRINL